MPNPIYITIDVAQYRIDWSFTTDATAADFEILVNGTQVVYATSNNGGFIFINPGDYVTTNTSCAATFPLAVASTLYVYDSVDGVLYSNTVGGGPFEELSYGPYYPSGDGEINADAHEY
jgi:hypothetical protein